MKFYKNQYHHKYYDDTMKVGYRKGLRYNAIAYNRFYIPNDLDKNYIKPVDMYVGTQELMRKGLLPAFFMGRSRPMDRRNPIEGRAEMGMAKSRGFYRCADVACQ